MMYVLGLVGRVFFLFELYGDHRDLPGLTHSFPAGRSSDLLHEGRNDLRAIGRMVDDDIARTNEIGDNAQVLLTEAGDRIGAIARRTNEVLAKDQPTRWAESSAHDLVIAARKVDDIAMDAHPLPEALYDLRAAPDALDVQERVDAGPSFHPPPHSPPVRHS